MIVVIALGTLLVGGHLWAAWWALQSSACPGAADCYPWGAEGPAAGSWRYLSKDNYVLIHCAQALLVTMGGAALVAHVEREERSSLMLRRAAWLAVAGWVVLFLF
jgi:hypothetical protein